MNQEKARSILRMFSGVADVKSLDPLLDEATAQVERMLLPDADRERLQLDYLCAALANLRHSQMLAAQSQLTYTYAGTVAKESDRGQKVPFAQALAEEYLKACADLLTCPASPLMQTGGQ